MSSKIRQTWDRVPRVGVLADPCLSLRARAQVSGYRDLRHPKLRMMSWYLVVLGGIGVVGCASPAPVHSEQGLAKRIGATAVVEGVYETDSKGDWVKTAWGRIPVQAKSKAAVQAGTYVWATGRVDRGHVVNGAFVPSTADFRGMRGSHDLALRDARVQHHAPPASQPTSMPSIMGGS